MQQGVKEEKITVVTLITCPEAADGFCKVCGLLHSLAFLRFGLTIGLDVGLVATVRRSATRGW
jgi:uncharacterized membrane protein